MIETPRPKEICNRSSGFTLLEILIATAVTMLLMLGLAQIFRVLGQSITQGRSALELNNRLRNVMMRIRSDLDNLTVEAPLVVPMDATDKGYLKYYDGPMTDYTLCNVDPNDADPTNGLTFDSAVCNPLLNRFGDLDDIFMATIKAKDTWFTGKVPRFLLEKRPPNPANLQAELADLVTISSEYAELVIFAQPTPISLNNPTLDNHVLAINPLLNFLDIASGIQPNPNNDDIPDSFRLHYRLLLIRPDLNDTGTGALFNYVDNPIAAMSNPLNRAMVAGPENLAPYDSVSTALPQELCDMYRIYQHCDLSVRRVYDFDPTTLDLIAANNLTDLSTDVSTRFAHVRFSLPNDLWSMPVIALGPSLRFQALSGTRVQNGFLHPAFTLMGDRRGEDILTSDLLAFDIKAFDRSAPLIMVPAANNIVLRPGDPGFLDSGLTSLSISNRPSALGDFVDLNWGSPVGKLPDTAATVFTALDYANQGIFVDSVLSGVNVQTNLARTLTDSFVKSGSYLTDGTNVLINQPSFDTYSTSYESDGIAQGQFGPLPARGVVEYHGSGTPPFPIDPLTDGIDNDGDTAIDEPDERTTDAPFKPPATEGLRGIQITVRLGNPASRQFLQMSTVKSFVPADD